MFRALWQRFARLFGGGKSEERRAPGVIPAPETLIAKIANVKGKDREILRVAGEAIRRGHPDQAVIAYWKAVEVYLRDGQVLKAVSALKMILQHSPEDLEAFNALADAYEALDRKRDAANTCLWIADIHARRGERADALAVLYRAMDLDSMVKGARERIQALGGELPASARPPSRMGPPLRLQSKQEPQAGLPPMALPLSAMTPSPIHAPEPAPSEDEPDEMPGESVVIESPLRQDDDDDRIELDIEGDDALDFPDDSLVLPVTDGKRAAVETPDDATVLGMQLPGDDDEGEEYDPDFGAATIAMSAIDHDVGSATIAMRAIAEDGEIMSEDLAGDATLLAMEPPPLDGPTDEHEARMPLPVEEETDPRATPPPARRFAIPQAATTIDVEPPSALSGTEHDPKKKLPMIGVPGESTRAYSVEELKDLGLKKK